MSYSSRRLISSVVSFPSHSVQNWPRPRRLPGLVSFNLTPTFSYRIIRVIIVVRIITVHVQKAKRCYAISRIIYNYCSRKRRQYRFHYRR